MDHETPENVSERWLTPQALLDFVEELRQDGYNIGTAEFIAAQDLLFLLLARGENLENPQRMAGLLGPLLCSTPAEQVKFPQQFIRWAEQRQAVLLGQAKTKPETLNEALNVVSRRGLRWEWALFVGVVVVLIVSAWYFLRTSGQPGPNVAIPASPIIQIYEEAVSLLNIAVVAIGLLIFAGAAWWAWWRMTASQFLARRQSNSTPDIQQVAIHAATDAVHPSLLFLKLARLFRERVETSAPELNVPQTIAQSLQKGGWLSPVYASRRVPPEYLVLIDRRSGSDHLAQFVEGMVNRLCEHGVFITLYSFDGDPRVCFPAKGKSRGQSLRELAAQHENMRLLVFSETTGLLSPVNGKVAPWAHLFQRWTQRAVVTPEPRDFWGPREQEVGGQFTVLPMTPAGMETFLFILNGQLHPEEVSGQADGALPSALQDRPQRWIERDVPPLEQVDALLAELRAYLGKAGYLWLAAGAVYPELHWPITVYLGETLRDEDGSPLLEARRLIDLARLPWFRYGSIPDWLRERLIDDLSGEQQSEIRAALEALLVTAVQGRGEAYDLEIARRRRDWTSRLARPLLHLLTRQASLESPVQDHVFLDFMLQRLNLAVRVPEALRRQLFTKTQGQPGWKILSQWVSIHLIVAVASVIFYLQGSSKTQMDVFLGMLIILSLLTGLAQWLFLRRFWKLNGIVWICASGIAAFIIGLAYYVVFSAYKEYYFYFGLLPLLISGIWQARLLSRAHISSAYLWMIVNVIAGVINTIGALFFTFQSESLTLISYILLTLGESISYSLMTGWVLLTFFYQKDLIKVSLNRLIWILNSAVSFCVGLLSAAFFMIFVLFLIFSPIFSDSTNNNLAFSSFFMLTILTTVISYTQSIQLRNFSFALSNRWFWISSLVFFLASIINFLGTINEYISSQDSLAYAVIAGILSGIGQAFVWRQSGLKPFSLLIWFLCASLGWIATFLSLQSLTYLSIPNTPNTILLEFLFSATLYGILTAFPLIPMLREALRLQQSEWALEVIANLAKAGPQGRSASIFLRSHWVPIRFKKLRNDQAIHTDTGIYLNANTYSLHTSPQDPYLLGLVAREAKQMEQGRAQSDSIAGQLKAWQTGFSIYQSLTGSSYHPAMARLLTLSPDDSRENLALAKQLMFEVAGPQSRLRRMPLYPWSQEILFWLTRRKPKLRQESAAVVR